MNRVTFPLKLRKRGQSVQDLQAVLQLLLDRQVILSDDEAARKKLMTALQKDQTGQIYGTTTKKLVALFQDTRSLPSTGEVDEPTANALNQLLEEMGVLGDGGRGQSDMSLTEQQSMLKELGYLTANFITGSLDEPTRAALARFQSFHDLSPTGAPSRASELALAAALARRECAVFGTVVDGDRPLQGVIVTVRDRDLDEPWPVLGTTPTNKDGSFVMLYQSDTVKLGDKVSDKFMSIADLIFSLSPEPFEYESFAIFRLPEDEQVTNLDSELGLQARRVEEVRFKMRLKDPRRPSSPSEYETLLAAFKNVWPNRSPGTLDETKRHVTFVAREIDMETALVQALADAHAHVRQIFNEAVLPETLYGLARCSKHFSTLAALAAASEGELKTGVLEAVARNLIPTQDLGRLDRDIQLIRNLAPQAAIVAPLPGRSSFSEVLKQALPEITQQSVLVKAYAEHNGPTDQFWDQLKQVPGFEDPKKLLKVQTALQLDAVTQGHAPLVQALQSDGGVDTLADLLKVSPHKLTAMVSRSDVGVPADVPGDDHAERTANYVRSILNAVRIALPTEAIAHAVASAPSSAIGGEANQAALSKVFLRMRGASAPFTIESTIIDEYMGDHGDEVLAGLDESQRLEVIKQLKAFQRIYRVTPNYEAFSVLLASGLDSANAISKIPRETFVAEYGPRLGEEDAMMLHTRALSLSLSALHTYVLLNETINGPKVSALNGVNSAKVFSDALVASVQKILPNWRQLFGQIELCSCEHCRSVYSPAAYLVDLFEFLGRARPNLDGLRPLDVLIGNEKIPGHRPDLAHVMLNCENTETPIPYIDIVNEALEMLVISGDRSGLLAYNTGSATTAELKAGPQHENLSAYVTPAEPGVTARPDKAVYPLSLPFDRAEVAAQIDLESMDIHLPELRETLGAKEALVSAARLNLSPAMYEVLAGLTVDGQPGTLGLTADELYGLTPDLLPVLNSGDTGRYVLALKRKLNTTGAALAIAVTPDTETFDAALDAALATWRAGQGLPAGPVRRADWEKLAAIDPQVAISVLPSAREFLTRTGLAYPELESFVSTWAVNPAAVTMGILLSLKITAADIDALITSGFTAIPAAVQPKLAAASVDGTAFLAWAASHLNQKSRDMMGRTVLLATSEKGPCDLDHTVIRCWDEDHPELQAEEWARLNRLIRLWRTLDWSLDDVDRTLEALDESEITSKLLTRLAEVKRLSSQLALPIADVVTLWQKSLDTRRLDSPYYKRFLNPARGSADRIFMPDWKHDVLDAAGLNEPLVDHLPALQAGLRLNDGELHALINSDEDLKKPNARLTLAGLTKLYRVVTLARGLRVRTVDLRLLLDLAGLDPFVVPDSGWSASRAVAIAQAVATSGINAAELDYLYRDATSSAVHPPAADTVSRTLAGLAVGLAQIATSYETSSDPQGEVSRAALGLLYVDPAEPHIEPPEPRTLLAIASGTDQYVVPLAGFPALATGVTIPNRLVPRLFFDKKTSALRLLGALTPDERDNLLTLAPTDMAYQAAIKSLFDMSRTALSTIIDAPLRAAPSEPKPSWVDAEKHLLDTSSFDDQGMVDAVALAGKFAYLLGQVRQPVVDHLSRSLVKQTFADGLQLDAALVALLLEGSKAAPLLKSVNSAQPNSPAMADFLSLRPGGDLTMATKAYSRLYKAGRLASALKLTVEEIATLAAAPGQGKLDLNALALNSSQTYDPQSFQGFLAAAALARLQLILPQPDRMSEVLAASSDEEAIIAFALAGGWGTQTVKVAAATLDILGDRLRDSRQLARLAAAISLITSLGTGPDRAISWANGAIDTTIAAQIRSALRSRYDDAGWLGVAPGLSNRLRSTQRDALVAYLVPRLGLPSAEQLFNYLLIDVQMAPCMLTSRIKQAISSVQTFIQRCLLNAEPEVEPDAIDDQQWKWIKNYRVWEANRKVFLYPENWIEPELRDDKTPLFKELESALLQDEVNTDTCEAALLDYLEKVDQLSKLDVVAMFRQTDFEPAEGLREALHVFARTPGTPTTYYYRQYTVNENGIALWTPWEGIPADVEGNLFTAAVYHRRTYFFWTLIVEKQTSPTPDDRAAKREPKSYWEIQLAWSERKHKAWSPKQVSGPNQVLKEDLAEDDLPLSRIEARPQPGRLDVVCITKTNLASGDSEFQGSYSRPWFDFNGDGKDNRLPGDMVYVSEGMIGHFQMDECSGHFVAIQQPRHSDYKEGYTTILRDVLSTQRLGPQNAGAMAVLDQPGADSTIVSTSVIFRQGDYIFYQDRERVYFVTVRTAVHFLDDRLRTPKVAVPYLPHHSSKTGLLSSGRPSTIESFARSRMELNARPQNAWALASAQKVLSTQSLSRTASLIAARPLDHLGMVTEGSVAAAMTAVPANVISSTNATLGLVARQGVQAVHSTGLAGDYHLYLTSSEAALSFETFYHPHVCAFIVSLRKKGLPGLFTLANQQLDLAASARFHDRYKPTSKHADASGVVENVDFGFRSGSPIPRVSPYATYNWEIFFHAPLLIATRLSQSQKFEDAMTWFQYLFNPTLGNGAYWQVAPLATVPQQNAQDLIQALNDGDPSVQAQLDEWRDHPFQPHLLARMRLAAYQKTVVMKYLDNLIAWADELFRRDTIESINEATQLYVLAATLLGERPQKLPGGGVSVPMTYAQLRGKLDPFGEVMVDFENRLPHISLPVSAEARAASSLLGMSRTLYFCIPQNDKLLSYWDTIADRLFKIRNCMNIEGVVRQLQLFEPPIDPALLVRARDKGIDLGSVLSDQSAPLPRYRFHVMLQRAMDFCNDLRGLGSTLLGVLEKKDAEALTLLRAGHEREMLAMMRSVKQQQLNEATSQRVALERAADTIHGRIDYFSQLLGDGLNAQEKDQFSNMDLSNSRAEDAAGIEMAAQGLHALPTFNVGFTTGTCGSTWSASYGGSNLGAALSAVARSYAYLSGSYAYKGNRAGISAGHERRKQDWSHQLKQARKDFNQMQQQIVAAQIRENIAQRDIEAHKRQVEQADEVFDFHRSRKFTNQELYGWMQGKLGQVYFQAYRMAYDLAKQAERCFRFQKAVLSSNHIAFGAWDSLRKGLLAGDQLALQLRQLERAYMEEDRRELELAKHISLVRHDPLAMMTLRHSGSCEIVLPEALFDADYPGHYLRRIKLVALTVPVVTGPFSGVKATLTLLSSSVRHTPNPVDPYPPSGLDDSRFTFDPVPIQSIATSSGQNDSGLFEANLHDERYLPFEGAGAVSRWRIEIDPRSNTFDLQTLPDVVLHLQYTALDGGKPLKKAARSALNAVATDLNGQGLQHMFSLKHEFSTDFAQLRAKVAGAVAQASAATIALSHEHFPFTFRGCKITMGDVDLFVAKRQPSGAVSFEKPSGFTLGDGANTGVEGRLPGAIVYRKYTPNLGVLQPGQSVSLRLASAGDQKDLDDIVLICHYTVDPDGLQ